MFFFSLLTMDLDSSSSSSSSTDEELDLMALAAAIIAERKKKKRKHRIWVKEIYQSRKRDGIHKLISMMGYRIESPTLSKLHDVFISNSFIKHDEHLQKKVCQNIHYLASYSGLKFVIWVTMTSQLPTFLQGTI